MADTQVNNQAATMAPDRPSSAYTAMIDDWMMVRTIMAGTTAMRAAGATYLPQYDRETDKGYKARLSRSVLTNHFEDAVKNVAALPFKKDVTREKAEGLGQILDDVDLQGNAIHVFAGHVFEDAVTAGLSYIMVDYPTAVPTDSPRPTLRDVKKSGARPYWVAIEAESVLACYYSVVAGRVVISYARILEETVEQDGFDEATVRRVRELFLDVNGQPSWILHRQTRDEKGAIVWVIEDQGTFKPLPILPLVPMVVGRKRKDGTVKPLFLDLAHKQVEHFQSASDQRNILTASRFPILACAGMIPPTGKDGEPPGVGPYAILATENPQGKWYWVEVTGTAIASGANDLKTLTDEMRIMGLQPIVADTGGVTATARGIDEARAHSTVQKAALNLQDALNQAIAITEMWLGRAPSASCLVNTDFGISLNASAEIDALIKMRQSGEISRDTFWTEMRRRDVLGPQFDPEEEALAIESEGPDVPPAADPALPPDPAADPSGAP